MTLLVLPSVAYAASICPEGEFSNLCNLKVEDSPIVSTVVQILLILAAVLSLIFLVWGGVRWIMSGGDKGKIEQARGNIIAAIVGLVIALLAYFIMNIVLGIFTGQGLDGMKIPTLY